MGPLSFLRKPVAAYKPVEADNFVALERDGLDEDDLPPARSTAPSQQVRRASRTLGTSSSDNTNTATYCPSTPPRPGRDSHASLPRVSGEATPISHPTPDLQILQGAYIGNISKLEQSAARMSLSMDIETELQKLREEQKNVGGSRHSSLQNSIQNSRPGSQIAGIHFGLDELPSASAYAPISNQSPFATSPVRSDYEFVPQRRTSRFIADGDETGELLPKSPDEEGDPATTRSPAGSTQTRLPPLKTVFEGSKEMERGRSTASNAYSESIYSPDGGQRLKRDPSNAYSESLHSVKDTQAPAAKPLPLRTAYGKMDSPSNSAPEAIERPVPHPKTSRPSSAAIGTVAANRLSGQPTSPSAYAPEAVTYQAYTPGAIQLVQRQSGVGASYSHALPRRRGSAGSMDTFQQAEHAFKDFDGAHTGYHGEFRNDESGDDDNEMEAGSYTKRTSTLTMPKGDSSSGLGVPAGLGANDKRVSFMPSAEEPEPDADRKRSMLSLMPDLDSKRKSTMSLGPVRPQTPPDGHIYYPAPIPSVLSLPPKLSQGTGAVALQRKKGQIIANARDSVFRPGMFEPGGVEPHGVGAELDPHLKASLFFDHKPVNYELKLIDGSASKTLDAILNAASSAPLGAFTDHPYAGVLGPEVYGPPEPRKKPGDYNKRASSANALSSNRQHGSNAANKRSVSGSALSLDMSEQDAALASSEGAALAHSNANGEDDENFEDEEDDGPDANDFQGEHPDYIPIDAAKPSTLLAELQLRKAEIKNRTRTAATAFPNGVHSTLLQLDAVAQHQARTRRGRQVRLAWEDPEMLGHDEADEDVPLGMLVPHAKRPEGGLLPPVPQARYTSSFDEGESRHGDGIDMEEEQEETLGQRKARLAREAEKKRFMINIEGIEDAGSNSLGEQEEESLAARRARLHRHKSSEFGSELMSQLGALSTEEEEAQRAQKQEAPAKKNQPARLKDRQSLGSLAAFSGPKQPEGEETLGQRRRRLQAQQAASEDAKRLQARVRSRHNSIDLLGGEPGPALFGPQPEPAVAGMPNTFPNHSVNSFQPMPGFGGPMNMGMPMQTVPGFAPGVLQASAFGYAPPSVPVAMPQQMQTNNRGQPAQPLGLLGVHMMEQQQRNHQYSTQRQAPAMPQMNMQQMQGMNSGRRDMVDRWRQGIA